MGEIKEGKLKGNRNMYIHSMHVCACIVRAYVYILYIIFIVCYFRIVYYFRMKKFKKLKWRIFNIKSGKNILFREVGRVQRKL